MTNWWIFFYKCDVGYSHHKFFFCFVGLAYQEGKDIVFRFIIEYCRLRDFMIILGLCSKLRLVIIEL